MRTINLSSPQVHKSNVEKKAKIVFALFIILCAALFVEVVIYKIVLPSVSSPKIICSGNEFLKVDEIASLLRPMENANWFTFNSKAALSVLASHPIVESVGITKKFPNNIFISIKERAPVAMTFIQQSGKSYPVLIDRNGVLFTIPFRNELNFDSTMPIISGLPIEHLSEGMKVPQKYRALIEQISDIQKLQQKYFAAVAEICVVPKEYGNYELVLIPVKTRTKVLTDRALNEDALQYMMVVLDVVNSIEPNVSVIDLRYGSVSYITN